MHAYFHHPSKSCAIRVMVYRNINISTPPYLNPRSTDSHLFKYNYRCQEGRWWWWWEVNYAARKLAATLINLIISTNVTHLEMGISLAVHKVASWCKKKRK